MSDSKIAALRTVFGLTQLAAGGLSVAASKVSSASAKAALNAAAPLATLTGYLGGNSVNDAYDAVGDTRAEVYRREIAVRSAAANIHLPAKLVERDVKARVGARDLFFSSLDAIGAVVALFFGAPKVGVAGAALGGTAIGALFGAAGLYAYEKREDLHPIHFGDGMRFNFKVRPSRIVQCFTAVGAMVGLGIAASYADGGWVKNVFNPSSSFLGAAIPPIASIVECAAGLRHMQNVNRVLDANSSPLVP